MTKTNVKLVLILLFLLLVFFFSCTEDLPSEIEKYQELTENLQRTLNEGIVKYRGIGISAAVIIPGQEMWTGVAGVSHGTTRITSDMVFSAGSITKMFTAATILQLIEDERLNLNDPLHQWLPDFSHIDNTITVKQLLNHTNGIYNITEHPDIWEELIGNSGRIWAIEELIRTYILTPYFARGTGWHYSNTGYLLLRMLIREATDSSITEQYRNRFFIPLGMTSSYLAIDDRMPPNVAHGWFDLDNDGDYDDLTQIPMAAFYSGAGGGVFCTAAELAIWARALLHEKNVLGETILAEMLDFHSPCPGEPMVSGYGLGVMRFEPAILNGLNVWGHGGNAPGYAAGCLYLPDYGVSIGFMDNTEEGNAMSTLNDLLEILIDYLER